MIASATTARRTERPPYVPRGAAWGALHSHAPACLVSGPAGTGKSLACLMKLHLCASCNPGFRGLLCRRTRKSLTDTGLVTFERDVLPPGHEARGKVKRDGRHSYPYANGSEVVVGGLDNVASIMSSDYDLVVILEATEATQDAVEMLSTRLRNGKMGYQQLLMDCNPDRPGHWLYQRSGPPGSGKAVLRLESRHEDNPVLWDAARNDWTPEGRRYVLGVLESLTGPRKLRLRYGRWVQAEGIVYEAWDPAVHLIDRFDVPANWPRYWSIDFGYTNPFACLMAALDGDGRLYVYRQVYHTKRLVTQHAERMKQLVLRDGRPAGIVADPEDREGRETLASLGFPSIAALKQGGAMGAGIQAVQARLKRAGDGRPRLFVLRDSLDERDADLAAARLPTCLEDEIDGYVWNNKGKDEPAPNQADHMMDALRYLTFALDAPRAPEEREGVTVCVT